MFSSHLVFPKARLSLNPYLGPGRSFRNFKANEGVGGLREERRVRSSSSCSGARPPPFLGTEPLSSFRNPTLQPANLCGPDLLSPLSLLEELKPEGHRSLRLRSRLPEASENKEDASGHISLSFKTESLRSLLIQGHLALVLQSLLPQLCFLSPLGQSKPAMFSQRISFPW